MWVGCSHPVTNALDLAAVLNDVSKPSTSKALWLCDMVVGFQIIIVCVEKALEEQ